MKELREICNNCGFTFGSHHAGKGLWPYNYCPATEHGLDFAQAQGTIFEPTGKYKGEDDVLTDDSNECD